MRPFFTVITPTLQRDSLKRTCASIDEQTFSGWEHIVMIDNDLANSYHNTTGLGKEKRIIAECGVRHSNFGNTCRHNAWAMATGNYVMYLDDDNYLAHGNVLLDIAVYLQAENLPDWAVFPIMRHGSIFFNDPPRICMTDTANIVVKREIGRWPDGPEYTMDGIWVEALKRDYPKYAVFPDVAPIVVMETSGQGQ